jgi:L-arabinose transport system substrate-binding protein
MDLTDMMKGFMQEGGCVAQRTGRETMHIFKTALLAGVLAVSAAAGTYAADVKIGFIVKQPEEPWFQDEWKFADMAAKEKGFTLVKIGAEDGEKVQSAIDNLGAQGAQGFIVCTPDVKLGPGIVAKAAANDLKLMTVDDRLVNADGSPIEDVPHMGISATKIGETVGETIVAEVKKRGWDAKDVGVIRVSYDQLPTAVDRVEGALTVLKANGFPEANIFDAPQSKTDTEAALNAATVVLNKNAGIKKWVAVGLNDEAVLGAVRATESVGIAPDSMIGVGIGGAESAINEFKKPQATGFFGTIIISPKRHGYETALNMYEWVANDKAPEKLILTSGQVALRDTYEAVRKDLGVE